MKLPPGMTLRIEATGLADGRVELAVAGLARLGAKELRRDLARDAYADPLDAFRAARDWLSARIVAEAEAHAPEVPPTFDAPAAPPEPEASDFDF